MQTSLPIRSFAIGAATGLRTMSGPTAVAMGTGWGRILPFLAVGELIADKLPSTPSRTIPAALVARMAGGALAGRSVAAAGGRNLLVGTLAGIAGAVGAAYAGAAYRKFASRHIPAMVAALLEDGVAIAVARTAANRS
jgi:uncharacterized membrane protein